MPIKISRVSLLVIMLVQLHILLKRVLALTIPFTSSFSWVDSLYDKMNGRVTDKVK
jgi:hypothetical protein